MFEMNKDQIYYLPTELEYSEGEGDFVLETDNIIQVDSLKIYWKNVYTPSQFEDPKSWGIRFIVMEWVLGESPCRSNGVLDHYRPVMRGYGFGDGIRHIWTEYQYYPNMESMIKAYQELRKLELLYCCAY